MSIAVSNKSSQPHTLQSLLARGALAKVVTLDMGGTYPTGGEAVSLGFTPDFVIIEPAYGYVFKWDYANSKVMAYRADYDAVADGALIEVANGVDLSACNDIRLLAIKVRR